MAVKVIELRRIEYDASLVPSAGLEVCSEFAAPAKLNNKDAAGHAFHAFALRQAGHVGTLRSHVSYRSGHVVWSVVSEPLVHSYVLAT